MLAYDLLALIVTCFIGWATVRNFEEKNWFGFIVGVACLALIVANVAVCLIDGRWPCF